jgi:hypothetical protein
MTRFGPRCQAPEETGSRPHLDYRSSDTHAPQDEPHRHAHCLGSYFARVYDARLRDLTLLRLRWPPPQQGHLRRLGQRAGMSPDEATTRRTFIQSERALLFRGADLRGDRNRLWIGQWGATR